MTRIQFLNANQRLPNERRSKLLDPRSELYRLLTEKRGNLKKVYGNLIAEKRMDFHIELLHPSEDGADLLVQRAKSIEGEKLSLTTECLGKALVVGAPYVEEYGNTHITIAYFPKGIPDDVYDHAKCDE